MTDIYSQCPKCGYVISPPLPASASCPKCGIYFFKWTRHQITLAPNNIEDTSFDRNDAGFIDTLFLPMEKMDSITFYGRCTVLLSLAVWSYFLFGYDYRSGEIGASFIHNILLPIHEAGHFLFRPFGEFMMILGGSLFQIALPFAIGISFITKQHDNFAASICLWWTSVSLLDLSPYIYDALHPQLILLGGGTGANDGPHDWIFLLITLDQIDNARHWGTFAHTLGSVMMLLALVWGANLLWKQHSLLDLDKTA